MQKAIIISTLSPDDVLDASDLNSYLSDGWSVAHVAPFGCSVSESANKESNNCSDGRARIAAILVIIEKNETQRPAQSAPKAISG